MEGTKKEKRKHNENGETPSVKHIYGREKKRAIVSLEDYDPRPLHAVLRYCTSNVARFFGGI